jgi:hypothetical protein
VSADGPTHAAFTLLDADVIERVRRLELFSRFRVEGFLNGLNRSPFKGFSADFLQHRQYYRGDSLKYLDWRVYGKTERLYVREYEELTNTRVSVILDVSASMGFKGPGIFTKHESRTPSRSPHSTRVARSASRSGPASAICTAAWRRSSTYEPKVPPTSRPGCRRRPPRSGARGSRSSCLTSWTIPSGSCA